MKLSIINKAIVTLLLIIISNSIFAQSCDVAIPRTQPESRYMLNGDGTATDKVTGLTWMRCAVGSWNGTTCATYPSSILWSEALRTAENSNFAGHSDWRLPNAKELSSIVERACNDPAINRIIFPLTRSEIYWTSTPFLYSTKNRNVHFYQGIQWDRYRILSSYTRLVRDGK